MKHLKPKDEFKFEEPKKSILDPFKNPGVDVVDLLCTEVTSLCPITGQPDYATVTIRYAPQEYCLESKSVKLYLGSFRNYGCFAEQMARRIRNDVAYMLHLNNDQVIVAVRFRSRGGVVIKAQAGRWHYDKILI